MLTKLLPYLPELNLIEQVWLRQSCLSDRKFNGYDNIINVYSNGLN